MFVTSVRRQGLRYRIGLAQREPHKLVRLDRSCEALELERRDRCRLHLSARSGLAISHTPLPLRRGPQAPRRSLTCPS
jgi:hypothetical protein